MQFSTSLLKFADIREEIKQYFLDKGIEYTEGSNFQILIDALAINNMISAYYTSVSQNEQYLSTCKTRENAVRIAKSLGYIPKRKIPSKFDIKMKFVGNIDITKTSFTLNEIKFLGKSTNFVYIANNVKFTKAVNDSYFSAEFTVYEKKLNKSIFYGNNDINQTITLTNENISCDDIDIRTVDSITSERWIDFEKYNSEFNDNFNDTTAVPNSTSKIYFIEEDEEYQYCPKITFGNGIIGAIPSTQEILEILYYETHGALGNSETDLELLFVSSTDNTNVTVDEFQFLEKSYVYGGKDNETLDEIKLYAPKYFQNSLVAITESDYKRLVLANENEIQYLDIIGGDKFRESEVFHLGKTYISVVPKSFRKVNNSTNKIESFPISEIYSLSLNDYDDVFTGGKTNFLDKIESRTIVSTSRKVISPSYLWIDIQPSIELKDKYLIFNEVAKTIYDKLVTYAEEEILGMGKKYREDKLIEIMDSDLNIFSSAIKTNFHILTNTVNLTDSYVISVPEKFIKTNYEQYMEDLRVNQVDYSFSNIPVEKRTIFADLKSFTKTVDENDTLTFNRYLINSNNTSKSMKLFANCFFNFVENEFVLNTSVSSSYSIGSGLNFAKTKIYGEEAFDALNSDGGSKIPLQFYGTVPTESVNNSAKYIPNYAGTEVSKRWFIYFVEGNKQTLLSEILQVNLLSGLKTFIARTISNISIIQPILEKYNLIANSLDVTEPYFYYNIFTEQNSLNRGKDFNVKMFYPDETGELSDTELIQIISRCKIGKCLIDANGLISFELANEITAFFDFYIDSNNRIVIYDKKWADEKNGDRKPICEIDFESKTFNVYKSYAIDGTATLKENFKSNKYNIITENEESFLYFYEIIDETNIGEYSKESGKISFKQSVQFNLNTQVQKYSLSDFLSQFSIVNSKNNDKEIIDIKLTQKNRTDDSKIIGQKSDINNSFGICSIPNIKMPVIKIV